MQTGKSISFLGACLISPHCLRRSFALIPWLLTRRRDALRFNIRIATPPFQSGEPIKDIPWGICSSYTFGLKAGDVLKISGPYGESFMQYDDRELIFLIGGAGSSFGRSHILQLFYTDKTQRQVTLWYGARSLKENIYQEEYEELARRFPNFHYRLVLSEPQPEDIAQGWPKDDPTKTAYLFKAFEEGQLKHLDSPEDAREVLSTTNPAPRL